MKIKFVQKRLAVGKTEIFEIRKADGQSPKNGLRKQSEFLVRNVF